MEPRLALTDETLAYTIRTALSTQAKCFIDEYQDAYAKWYMSGEDETSSLWEIAKQWDMRLRQTQEAIALVDAELDTMKLAKHNPCGWCFSVRKPTDPSNLCPTHQDEYNAPSV